MWRKKKRKNTFHWHDPTPLCIILDRLVKEAQLVSSAQANSGKQPTKRIEPKELKQSVTNKIIHGWTPLQPQSSILQSSSSLFQGLEMFLYPHRTCRYIYPSSLLSANTFTFLVPLSNKRGGMSRDLLTLLKQTAMKSLYWGAHPDPRLSSLVHPRSCTRPAAPQCRLTVLRFEFSPFHSQFLPLFQSSLN